jgi:hypothetical protein
MMQIISEFALRDWETPQNSMNIADSSRESNPRPAER